MNQQKTKLYTLINLDLENIDPQQFLKTLNSLNNLSLGLKKGQSTLLQSQKSQYSTLASLLQFKALQKGNEKLQANLKQFNPSQNYQNQYDSNKPKILQENEFDEEQNEINFKQNPQIYRDVSYGIQTVLVTNCSENAVLAQEIQVDHMYNWNIDAELQGLQGVVKERGIGLVIVDLQVNQNNYGCVVKQLGKLDEILSIFDKEYENHTRLIISPLFSGINNDNVLNYQQQHQKVDQNVLNLIPVQTRNYSLGNIKPQSEIDQEKMFSVSIYYEDEQNRTDNINDFQQFLDFDYFMENLNNGIIDINCMYREIIFKSGKLPKFGA